MKKAVVVLLLAVVAILAVALLRPLDEKRSAQAVTGLPWQIEILADGNTRVFGLTLGTTTLEEARQRFGPDMDIALIAAQGESGAVEAYYSQVTAGVIGGKMILSADLDKEQVDTMRQRAVKSEFMESGTRKFSLHPDDLARAVRAPITAITFIPAASLDEGIVLGRFGQPGERIRATGQVEHFLYPDKGLSVTLDKAGKELLQYVAPRQFARLREPLAHQAGK